MQSEYQLKRDIWFLFFYLNLPQNPPSIIGSFPYIWKAISDLKERWLSLEKVDTFLAKIKLFDHKSCIISLFYPHNALWVVEDYSFSCPFKALCVIINNIAERSKELCAWDAFLTQNVVDVFRVLRIALRVAILSKDNCHTSLEWSSHNGLKTVTQEYNSW